MKISDAIQQLQKILSHTGDVELMTHIRQDADGNGERSTLYDPAKVTGFYTRKDGHKSYHVQVIYED